MADPRKHARNTRTRKRVPVSFSASGEVKGSGHTVNLSPTGVGVATTAVQPKGTRLRLELEVEGKATRIHGEVVWARRPTSPGGPGTMGVKVVAADPRFKTFAVDASGTTAPPPPRPAPRPEDVAPIPALKPTYVYPVENTFLMVESDEESADENLVVALLREIDDWEEAFGPEQGTPLPHRHRRPQRHEVQLKAKYGKQKAREAGVALDVSATGLSIKASAFFVPGTRLSVELAVGRRAVTAQAEVVRVTLNDDGTHLIGLKLVEVDARYEAFVRRLAIDPDREE